MTHRFELSGDPIIIEYLVGELNMYRDRYLERPFQAVLRNFFGKEIYLDDFSTCNPVYAGHHVTGEGLILALQVTNTTHDHVMMLLNTITGLACDGLPARAERTAEIHDEWNQKTTSSAVIQLHDPSDSVYSINEMVVRAKGITFTLMPLWMSKENDIVIWEEWHTIEPSLETVFLDMIDHITEIVSVSAIDKKGHPVKNFTVKDITFFAPKPHAIPRYVVEEYNNDPFRKVADRAVDRLRAHVDKQFSELSARLAAQALLDREDRLTKETSELRTISVTEEELKVLLEAWQLYSDREEAHYNFPTNPAVESVGKKLKGA